MDVLITGAGGFLGSYILEKLLARKDRVRAFCRSHSPALKNLGVEITLGDLRRRDSVIDACQGVEAVFHVAGLTGLGGAWRDFYQINTLGTRWIIEGCQKHGVRRLVFTSSPSVIFDGNDLCGVDESTPYARRWLCHYARSKALAEQEVLAANGSNGLLTCALRPHLIWGPRDRSLVPRLWDRARRGRLVQVGLGSNLIDTTYVENAADAHIQAADALASNGAPAGKAYFISQGEPVNCWAWINELLALADLPPVRKSMSFARAWMLGACFEAWYGLFGLPGDPPLTRFLAGEMARSHYFSIARAKADFGFSPAVSTADGMSRLAQWRGTSGQLAVDSWQ
ncbi:MAG: NAD-dependent epimerase/dehydratase family protein [Thermoguttaceae bacterium]